MRPIKTQEYQRHYGAKKKTENETKERIIKKN